MKGLILKDFYILWKYYKFFLLFVSVLLVVGCALSQAVFFVPLKEADVMFSNFPHQKWDSHLEKSIL